MNSLFSSCLESNIEENINKLQTFFPQPLKYRVASSLNLLDLGIRKMAEPGRKEKYTFPRGCLRFLSTDKCHIPFIYFPSVSPQSSTILVYCHGSSSTLNNVYDFANSLALKYDAAVFAYDYTGDGESKKEFSSYEQDLKLILAWVISEGYKLNRTVLCGFSLGSYSALALCGMMPRILISPICGIISYLEGEGKRYEHERYDTVEKALKIDSRTLIFHCAQQMVHISHGQLIFQALKVNSEQKVILHRITDRRFEHRSAPSYMSSSLGEEEMKPFLKSIAKDAKKNYDQITLNLEKELLNIVFFLSEDSSLDHLTQGTNK